MSPIFMALLLLGGWGLFAWSAHKRWKLMIVGVADSRWDQPGRRLALTIKYAFAQLRMRRYPLAGIAHMLVFSGFLVLLLRTMILWGRGFDESFNFWLFGSEQLLGKIYSPLKDLFIALVVIGALVFVYYRMIKRLKRMTLSTEGLVIIWIIVVMMLGDVFYDGASMVRHARADRTPGVALAPIILPGSSELADSVEWVEFRGADGTVDGTVVQRVPSDRPVDPDAFETKQRDYMTEPDSPLARTELSMRFTWLEPAGSLAAMTVQGLSDGELNCVRHAGFWTHVVLVLIFLNLLPYSKHFHVITAIPNVYTQSLHPPGRLPPIIDIDGKLEREETLGIKRIDQFSWKSILDLYTCTECGRCSDFCPATITGKKLSPKHFTLDLRDFLYKHETALVAAKAAGGASDSDPQPSGSEESAPRPSGSEEAETRPSGSGQDGDPREHEKDLVDGVIDPEVLWACTSCRACETECPVFITYVDKIVDMRRYLVQERGEFPGELQTAFRSLESASNPWGFPADDRAAWADGLDIKTLAQHPDAEVILWVGCAPAFDERAKKVSRATAQLMQQAGVDFAILGTEEQCTGDMARRAGNEYLFQRFARHNVETLNGYGADKKKIVTSCPHCLNTLKNEYPDFGGHYDVIHHTTLLADLVAQGKLKPTKRIDKRVVFHDSCYLGRYNDIYDAPREVLSGIPGLTVLEPTETRDRGMCCGAGGAQMFKEEEPGEKRVNVARTEQLLETNPDAVASACPFCMRMLTDGLAEKNKEDLPQIDIAEMLLESVQVPEPAKAT